MDILTEFNHNHLNYYLIPSELVLDLVNDELRHLFSQTLSYTEENEKHIVYAGVTVEGQITKNNVEYFIKQLNKCAKEGWIKDGSIHPIILLPLAVVSVNTRCVLYFTTFSDFTKEELNEKLGLKLFYNVGELPNAIDGLPYRFLITQGQTFKTSDIVNLEPIKINHSQWSAVKEIPYLDRVEIGIKMGLLAEREFSPTTLPDNGDSLYQRVDSKFLKGITQEEVDNGMGLEGYLDKYDCPKYYLTKKSFDEINSLLNINLYK